MDKSKLQEIRNQLFFGGIKEIAKRAKTSTTAVSHVFNGRYVNYEILQAIAEVAKEHKERRDKVIQSLNDLVDE